MLSVLNDTISLFNSADDITKHLYMADWTNNETYAISILLLCYG